MQQNVGIKFSIVNEKYWAGWEGGGGRGRAKICDGPRAAAPLVPVAVGE